MLKILSIVVLAVSFNLAPVAKAQNAETKTVKTEKVEAKSEAKSDAKADAGSCEHCKKGHKHGDKDCACKDAKDCKCSKKDCDSGECKKKDSKKFCKHCAEHDAHGEHKDEHPAH